MTRDEAMYLLNNLRSVAEGKEDEAIDMAIEALSAEDVVPYEDYRKLLYSRYPDELVRCKDCRYANECHKSVQYTRNEQNTVTIGYSPIEWCSRGERREP